MKNVVLMLAALLARSTPGRAQSVGIGTATPNASAALDIKASDRGLLIPRLTATQRTAITAPPQGLMVYQTDGTPGGGPQTGFWYYAGTPAAWVFLNPTGGGADSLGNHTATLALNLGPNPLTGTGASVGTAVGVGVRADGGLNLGQNTPGNNVLLGYQAGATTTGSFNTFSGYQAGAAATTGSQNQFSGYQSGYVNSTGIGNLFVGYQSGIVNTTGSNNWAFGYLAGPNVNNLTNAGAIGYQATVSQSNSLALGSTGVFAVNVGIGTSRPSQRLEVNGNTLATGTINMGWTQLSGTYTRSHPSDLYTYLPQWHAGAGRRRWAPRRQHRCL
jgi:hypothetical protein